MVLLTRRGLWTLPFLHLFIKRVKAVVSFLRGDIDAVVDDMEGKGMPALGGLMRLMPLPQLADWHWCTVG